MRLDRITVPPAPPTVTTGSATKENHHADASANAVADMGAQVLRGDLNDTDVLCALESDGVIHLAFVAPSVSEAATPPSPLWIGMSGSA